MKYKKNTKEIISDLYTAVGCFLRLRQKYNQVLLLESSDYSSKENSKSFICFKPLEGIEIRKNNIKIYNVSGQQNYTKHNNEVLAELKQFVNAIHIDKGSKIDGIFGYTCYESIQYFDTLQLDQSKETDDIPTMKYDFYKYVIVIDHYHDRMEIHEYLQEGEASTINEIIQLLDYKDVQTFSFQTKGDETSNITDELYKSNIRKAKSHLQNGDIFQVVLSRRYNQRYAGDEFNVYRTLRTINPSPYLYFFDYGAYKIFGSSPEAQISIVDNKAEIHPIAGTFKRTGDTLIDLERAEALRNDPKENAEHVMLVDLARNDLSRHTTNVHVKKYQELQYFSHVIHLTSVVEGTIEDSQDSLPIYAATFPAGTLSGAPKYKAMQIIDQLETTGRGFYGGAIGMIGLNGDINQAILIRSFLAKDKTLRYQAGAGIVIDSNEESELQEVNNKLAALQAAIEKAKSII
jgi:anthranilate synthase component 1